MAVLFDMPCGCKITGEAVDSASGIDYCRLHSAPEYEVQVNHLLGIRVGLEQGAKYMLEESGKAFMRDSPNAETYKKNSRDLSRLAGLAEKARVKYQEENRPEGLKEGGTHG